MTGVRNYDEVNVLGVYAGSEGSDQPAHARSLIRGLRCSPTKSIDTIEYNRVYKMVLIVFEASPADLEHYAPKTSLATARYIHIYPQDNALSDVVPVISLLL